MCMAGPAFYWLIDEGEEKDSVFQKKKKKRQRKANSEKKTESINLVASAFVYSLDSCGS